MKERIMAILDTKKSFKNKLVELQKVKNENVNIFQGLISADKEVQKKWIRFVNDNKDAFMDFIEKNKVTKNKKTMKEMFGNLSGYDEKEEL